MSSTCDICRISLSSQDLKSHLKGKKHLKKLDRIRIFGGDTKGELKTVLNPGKSPEQNQPPKLTPQAANQTPTQVIKNQAKRKREGKQLEAKTEVPNVVIDKSKTFPQQLDSFLRQIEQTQVERQRIKKVLADIAFTFSRVLPDVMPVLYGSQLSGLAFRTSDIDVYLCNPRGGEEDPDFIRRHGKIIYRTHLFSNIVHVTRARVPVIKAKHIRTGIELDISATSGQAVANSLLLRFILSYDPRISKIMMLIGYWAKKCQLITTSKFSRYSINLLIISYLQNLPEPILPPLYKLVHGVPGKTWPFRINEDESLLKNTNYLPLHSLFMGFFEYFKDFPFTKFVISTYLGRQVPVKDMDLPEVLDRMVYYKTYLSCGGEKLLQRIVCIQDPLELCHNTSKAVTQKTLEEFQLSCMKLIDLKEKHKVEEWLYEIVHGDAAKPVLKKTVKTTFGIEVHYNRSTNWIDNFMKDFIQILKILGIRQVENVTNSDEAKRTKLNPNSLHFSLETNVLPFTEDFRKLFGLLKEGNITLEYFSKYFTPKLKQKQSSKFLFSAMCFISSSPKPETVKIIFTNTGDPSSFYTLLVNLKKSLPIFMNLLQMPIVQPKTEKETTEIKEIDKDEKESKQ